MPYGLKKIYLQNSRLELGKNKQPTCGKKDLIYDLIKLTGTQIKTNWIQKHKQPTLNLTHLKNMRKK